MSKTRAVLKNESWIGGHCCPCRFPVNLIIVVNIEVGNNRPSLNAHVGRRIKVGLLDILQMLREGLLRSATGAGMFFDRSCIHHDGKSKARVGFSLFHYLKRSEITRRSLPIPVNDDAINTAR